MNTEPIVIPIQGDPSDFVADANKVNSSLSSVENSTKKTSISITDMRSAFQLAADAARIAGEVWQNTAGVAVDLANDVRSLRDVTGQSAEESSRLIQVLDDYKITVEDADKATKKLASEGMEFNIETIARLSDEFLKLNPGVERTTFLYDNFGKSGDRFAEIMLQGGDAILAANEAISKNLVLSDKQLKAARDYEKALDNTNDAILAYKVAIGNELLPVVTEMAEVEARVVELMEEGLNPYEARRQAAQELTISHMELMEGMKELNVVTEENTTVIEESSISIEDLSKANQDYLNTIGDVTKQIDDYNEKQEDLKSKHAELLEEKQKLLDQGWWAESDAVQAINDKLADNEAAQEKNASAMEEATHRRMLAMLEEQLSIDGLDERESTFLLEQGKKWGIYSAEAIAEMDKIQKQIDAMERLIDININVLTTYSEAGNAAKAVQVAGEKDYNPTNQHADGGSFMIPMGYGNEGFRMGNRDSASGGELVQITPRGQDPNKAVVEAIYATRITAEDIARAVVVASQQVSK